jgi:hypothetical protein
MRSTPRMTSFCPASDDLASRGAGVRRSPRAGSAEAGVGEVAARATSALATAARETFRDFMM